MVSAPPKASNAVHGYGAYTRGLCHCDEICRPIVAKRRRQQRAARLSVLVADSRHPSHGLRASYDAGCRCGGCTDARHDAGVRLGEHGHGRHYKRGN